MNHDELAMIEQRLAVQFPRPYRDSLLKGVRIGEYDPEPYFHQDSTELLIANLELRMFPGRGVFAGAAWPSNQICIGKDGCGNYYSISVTDAQCAVWIFDHEANRFETISDNLDHYFAYISELINRTAVLFGGRTLIGTPVAAVEPSPDAVLARSRTPRESVLNPISMDEWAAFVDSDADLEMQGYRTRKNPFTGGEIRIDYPGLATMHDRSHVYEFLFAFGRIIVTRPAPAVLAKLEQAAVALNGRVLTGW